MLALGSAGGLNGCRWPCLLLSFLDGYLFKLNIKLSWILAIMQFIPLTIKLTDIVAGGWG